MSRVFNLTFHGIGDPPRPLDPGEEPYWIDVAAFEQVLEQAAQWRDGAITFDDGNASDLHLAVPRLHALGLTATFFVLAGRVGKPGCLGVSELRDMLAAGMCIGSHGMHHRGWRRLPDPALREEIFDAKASLEDLLGTHIADAACPFGLYGRRALGLLAHAGYSRVYTSDRGWAKKDHWLQARNTVSRACTLDTLREVRGWGWTRRLTQQCKTLAKRLS